MDWSAGGSISARAFAGSDLLPRWLHSIPGLKIETWATRSFVDGQTWATRQLRRDSEQHDYPNPFSIASGYIAVLLNSD